MFNKIRKYNTVNNLIIHKVVANIDGLRKFSDKKS